MASKDASQSSVSSGSMSGSWVGSPSWITEARGIAAVLVSSLSLTRSSCHFREASRNYRWVGRSGSAQTDQRRYVGHVGEDLRAGFPERVGVGQSAAVAEHAHACCDTGLHAVHAVLEHDAALWLHAHPGGRVEEQVRGGLAVLDLEGTEDASVEAGAP